MAASVPNCCASTDCCMGSLEEEERPKAAGDQRTPSSERSSSQFHATTPSSPPSIVTASSSTAIDTVPQHISVDNLERHHSHSSNSSTGPPQQGAGNFSCTRRLLNLCQRPAGSSCCPPDRFKSMICHQTTSGHKHGHEQDKHESDHCDHSSGTYASDTHLDNSSDDVEHGPATIERIILTVSGLKCGCCETGLTKGIRRISAIKNYQVNTVLAKVEIDLDTSRLSVSEVISRLQKATGYTFERYDQPEGQVLELSVSDPTDLFRARRPYGVTLLESGDKQTWNPSMLFSGRNSIVPSEISNINTTQQKGQTNQEKRTASSLFLQTIRVHYDARQIGARDVFEYYQQLNPSQSVQLAAASSHPSLSVGAQQTKRACFMFLITLLFTAPVLVFAWAPVDHKKLVYAHISLALATLVQIIAVKEFVPGAFQSLIRSGLFEMDFLIAMSTTTAFVFSVVSYIFQVKKRPLETGSFFETSTLLVTLILLGRAVSEFARFRAAKSVSIRSLQTQDALIVISVGPTGPGQETRKIDARLLQYGDHFKVLPHTRIVTDGKVIYGGSEVDESMITGESVPVAKGLGHRVHAGTTNGAGQLIVALTKLPYENSVSRIATMVENAELSKPKAQALADQIAGWFAPAIATIGAIVFLIWLFVDRYHNHRPWGNAVVRAITYAIATLIVSCPCAIGLAVPMVVLIAGGSSARFGVIFRDPQKLEVARNTTDVVFDKTGTLTTGQLSVVGAEFHGTYPKQIKNIILGLLEGDKHPVASAVVAWLNTDLAAVVNMLGTNPHEDEEEPGVLDNIVDIKSEPGNGVSGMCEGSQLEVRAGNPEWLGVQVLESPYTMLCVTVSGVLSATFRLQDRARPKADKIVELLTSRGISVHMISGDGEGAVNEIAHTINIPKSQTRWGLKPMDKQRYIHELQKEGAIVVFCGDGTNDSVALKQADVGVHLNHGSDMAKSASDVVLMTTRLQDILIMLDISRAAYSRIVMNFGWSAMYNVIAILMAAGAFVRFRIPPEYAGLGELVSVLPVVFIAFQMKWRNYGSKYRAMDYE